MIKEIADNTGEEPHTVENILNEFCFQIHKGIFEYEGLNRDYIGEELHGVIPEQAFYHLIGFLQQFAEKYGLDEDFASEYLGRLGTHASWLPYRQQTENWKNPK